MSTEERAIPVTCPSCQTVLATGYTQHCDARWCGWVKCNNCPATIDTRSGRFHMGRKAL